MKNNYKNIKFKTSKVDHLQSVQFLVGFWLDAAGSVSTGQAFAFQNIHAVNQ